MPLRVGFLGVAHMHSYSYAACLAAHPEAENAGVWDCDAAGRAAFAKAFGAYEARGAEDLFERCDAVIVCSQNKNHAEDIELAAEAGKPILCEKPLVTSEEEGARALGAAERAGVPLMTAFPCRYSAAFQRLVERVRAGEIGTVRAVCATNRGSNPGGWFVDPAQSGGGAMIDHTVHVADLLRVLLQDEVARVQAQTGNRLYGQEWEDTAMLTLEFENGVFATLDSSWSRPKSFKTWGDVTMNVVGDQGVLELDMFGQEVDVYQNEGKSHSVRGFGSNIDAGLVDAFVRCVLDGTPPPITGFDGLQAARVALAGYQSVRDGQPVAVVR